MIDKIRYRLVYNRRNKLNGEGKALIQIEARNDARKIYISTKIYITPDQWDCKKKIIINHQQCYDLNAFLQQSILDMQALELDRWKRNTNISLDDLKALTKKKVKPAVTFLDFCEQIVNDSDRRDSTKGNLLTTIKVLRTMGRVDYDTLDNAFVRRFEKLLQERGLKVNTVGKHLRNLRTLINEAVRQGYMRHNPITAGKIPKEKKQHDYLRKNEVRRLEKLQIDERLNEKERHILDAFLFCVYSGLRFSDFRQMTDDAVTRDGSKVWYEFTSVKTSVYQKLPLHLLGECTTLLDKYDDVAAFAAIPNNSTCNATLHHLADITHIKRKMTFHLARHTCATLLLDDGMPITSVQRILGHTAVRTTEIYAETTDDTVCRDLRRRSRQ